MEFQFFNVVRKIKLKKNVQKKLVQKPLCCPGLNHVLAIRIHIAQAITPSNH